MPLSRFLQARRFYGSVRSLAGKKSGLLALRADGKSEVRKPIHANEAIRDIRIHDQPFEGSRIVFYDYECFSRRVHAPFAVAYCGGDDSVAPCYTMHEPGMRDPCPSSLTTYSLGRGPTTQTRPNLNKTAKITRPNRGNITAGRVYLPRYFLAAMQPTSRTRSSAP